MDQCITKQVLHVYTIDMCSILSCNNMTVYPPISQVNSHECLVNVCLQYTYIIAQLVYMQCVSICLLQMHVTNVSIVGEQVKNLNGK